MTTPNPQNNWDQLFQFVLSETQLDQLAQRIAELVSVDDPADEWLTKSQAAKLLCISVSSLEKRTHEGVIPGHKIGSCRRYKRAELLALSLATSAKNGET